MVDFNANFGYNVRNYQQMNGMRFGSGIRTGMNPQNAMYSMNSSLFKLDGNFGDKNMFAGVNTNQSFNFNGVNYDNAYAMLNSVGDGSNAKSGGGINFGKVKDFILKGAGALGGGIDKGIEALGKFGKKVGEVATKAANGIKNGINKLFGKKDKGQDNNVGKALDNLKNAQDKETLTQALDGAKLEQQANAQKGAAAEKAEKAAEKGKTEADKKADASNKKLEEDKAQLENDNKALEQAKADVQTAKANLDAATQGVAQAEQALAQAKSAATSENPNTAAINAAEQQLQAAKEKEAQAREDLTAKENAQTEAQKKVDDQTGVVRNSETENKQAQEGVSAAEQEVRATQQEAQVVQTESQQIGEGVQEGEQRLEQMETNPAEGEAPAGANSDGTSVTQDPNAPSDPFAKNQYESNNKLIENGGYSAEQKEAMYQARENIRNMQPGDTIRCGADEYAMDANGNMTINGQPYETNGLENPKELFAENAVGSVRAKANSDNEFDREIALMEGDSKSENTSSANQKAKTKNDKKSDNTNSASSKDKPAKSEPNTTGQTKPAGDSAESRGFSENSQTSVYESENSGKRTVFQVQDGKYMVNGQEVSEKEFVARYDDASSKSTRKQKNTISHGSIENSLNKLKGAK